MLKVTTHPDSKQVSVLDHDTCTCPELPALISDCHDIGIGSLAMTTQGI